MPFEHFPHFPDLVICLALFCHASAQVSLPLNLELDVALLFLQQTGLHLSPVTWVNLPRVGMLSRLSALSGRATTALLVTAQAMVQAEKNADA